jgi:hypothetical protein
VSPVPASAGGPGSGAGGPDPDPELLDDSRLRALGLVPGPEPLAPGTGTGAAGASTGTGDPDGLGPADADADADADDGAHAHGLPDTPMWLSHHWPPDYDRCAVVAGLHVCRRCLVLYPLALVAGIAISIGGWWDHGWDPWVLWLFPLPGVVEFVLDNLGVIAYRPRRQVVLSAFGALAAGVGYVRYLDDLTDPLVWSVVGVYTAACLSAAVVGGLWKRRARRTR